MISYSHAGADISPDGRYRYHLWREWRGLESGKHWRVLDANVAEPLSCLFVMLNPSTADGTKDDPTIRRCVSFAKREGYDRMDVVNLFAHRATDPREILRMLDRDEPYGPRNQSVIERAVQDAGVVVCAWGAHGSHLNQDQTVRGWLDGWGVPMKALGFTGDGSPRHPLYVKGDAKLVPMPA